MITVIRHRIDILRLSLTVSTRIRESYLNELARARADQALSATGETIDLVYETIALRHIGMLDDVIAEDTRSIQEWEIRLQALRYEDGWLWSY